jgi:pyridinium-3,5-bisthiocarboxylic acid mononucleotide nickel chelatase
MTICYLDAFSGISGDMLVGALVDAGANATALNGMLVSLGTGASFAFEKVVRGGIAATKFRVSGGHSHHHRHLEDIREMIGTAALAEPVRRNACLVFEKLGAAEAQVHNTSIDHIHFHEVGAVDSIADIVGACAAFHLLGVDEIVSSPLNVGSGTVKTEHGMLPVPAPATVALLVGKPVYSRGPQLELTTPTGAAVAATLASRFDTMPPMRVRAVGYGAGDHEFAEQPNVLRVMVGESNGAVEATTVAVLEANIDDSTPEVLGFALERLIEKGALDATLSPLVMKKNRPGVLLRVIARPEDQETLAALIIAETSTFGVRIYAAERRVEARQLVEVQTPHGKIRVKVASGGAFAPEYEDCRRAALDSGAPLKQILAEAGAAYLNTIR